MAERVAVGGELSVASDEASNVERGAPQVTTILVVRHGESESNRDGRFAGHVESSLTERGRAQARALGDRLAETAITRIVSSDLERARETAELVGGSRSLPVVTDARLREMSFGEWEGMVEAEIVERWAEDWEAVLRPKAEFRAPGGESLRELRARMSAVYGEFVEAAVGESVLMVTHGNAIAALLASLLQIPYANSWRFQVSNCGLTRIHHVEGVPVIVSVNDTSHLNGSLDPKGGA